MSGTLWPPAKASHVTSRPASVNRDWNRSIVANPGWPGMKDLINAKIKRREAFRQRRDFLLPALRELGFRIEVEPQGAFYLYADVSAFTDDAQAFCAHFLETEHVAFTPGLDFGFHRANQHVRLAYTQEVPRLQEAVARIARGLQRWQGSR